MRSFSKRSRVIAVSKVLENSDEIKRFEDLSDAKWSGKVCSRPGSHVYNRALLSSIIAANGNEAAASLPFAAIIELKRARLYT